MHVSERGYSLFALKLAIMPRVLLHAAVEKRRLEPVQCDGDVRDGVENNLCIQVLNEIVVQATW